MYTGKNIDKVLDIYKIHLQGKKDNIWDKR